MRPRGRGQGGNGARGQERQRDFLRANYDRRSRAHGHFALPAFPRVRLSAAVRRRGRGDLPRPRLTKPAIRNYVNRNIVIHCGNKRSDVTQLGVYELGFIAALGRSGIGPALAATLFRKVLEAAPHSILDRNYSDPLFAVITLDDSLLECDAPAVIVTRGWRAADFALSVSVLVNLSSLFGRINRDLNRACQRKDQP
jgi:hypothetical protein